MSSNSSTPVPGVSLNVRQARKDRLSLIFLDVILFSDQTEEWKGWMQVMFVWYHVFAAKEWYNWIRVYIAAYVWMTGFGKITSFALRYLQPRPTLGLWWIIMYKLSNDIMFFYLFIT